MNKNITKLCGNVLIAKRLGRVIKSMWATIDVLDTKATVLDEEVQMYGGYVKLPITGVVNPFGKPVDIVTIPSMAANVNLVAGHTVLDPIQVAVEHLLYAIEQYNQGMATPIHITNAAKSIWGKMALALTGKSGLINKYMLGCRVRGSCRAHVATSLNIRHDVIALPRHIYRDFIKEWRQRCIDADLLEQVDEPYVLFFREPVLHNNSMRVVDIMETKSDRIVCHPTLTPGMNADSDGDAPHVILGYPGMKPEESWEGLHWDKEFLITNNDPTPNLDNII